MAFVTLKLLSGLSVWARNTFTRIPLGVRPGNGGMCLKIQEPEERHYSRMREQNESSYGF